MNLFGILVIAITVVNFVCVSAEINGNSTSDAVIKNDINNNKSNISSVKYSRKELANETLKSEAQSQNPYLDSRTQNPYLDPRTQSPGVAAIPILGPLLAPVLNRLIASRQLGSYDPQSLAGARQRGLQPGTGAGLNPYGLFNLNNFIPNRGLANNAARQRQLNQRNLGLYNQQLPVRGNNYVPTSENENQPEEEQGDGQEDGQGEGQDGAQGSQEGQDPSQDPNQDPDIQQFQNLQGSNFPADLFPPGILSQNDIADIQKGIEEQQKREAEKQKQQEEEQEQPEDGSNETEGAKDSNEGVEAEGAKEEQPQTGNERDAIGDKKNLISPYENPVTVKPLTLPPVQPQSPYSQLNPLTPIPVINPNLRNPYGRRQPNQNPYPDYDYDRPEPRRPRPGILNNEEPINYNRFDRFGDRRSPPRSRIEENVYRDPRQDHYSSYPRQGAERGRSRIRFDDDDEINAYRRLPRRPVYDSPTDGDYTRGREEAYRQGISPRDDPRRYRPELGGQYSNVAGRRL